MNEQLDVFVYANPASFNGRWMYILTNPFSKSHALRYLRQYRGHVRSLLIDTGVHTLFAKRGLSDYPRWFIREYIRLVSEVTQQALALGVNTVYYVVPDVPADYPGMEDLFPYNVEKTIKYLEIFRAEYVGKLKPAIPIAVVQGKKDDAHSTSLVYRKYQSLYDYYPLIAIGPTCSTRKYKLLAKQIRIFDATVGREYHVFGAHIKALDYAMKLGGLPNLYSLDTNAYTFYVFYRHNQGRRLTNKEKERRFIEYMEYYHRKARRAKLAYPKTNLSRLLNIGVGKPV